MQATISNGFGAVPVAELKEHDMISLAAHLADGEGLTGTGTSGSRFNLVPVPVVGPNAWQVRYGAGINDYIPMNAVLPVVNVYTFIGYLVTH